MVSFDRIIFLPDLSLIFGSNLQAQRKGFVVGSWLDAFINDSNQRLL